VLMCSACRYSHHDCCCRFCLAVCAVGEGVPSPSSKVLVSGSYDTTVRFWDLNTFRCMRKCDGHNDAVRVLAAYNGRVFSGSYDGTIGVSGVSGVAGGSCGRGCSQPAYWIQPQRTAA